MLRHMRIQQRADHDQTHNATQHIMNRQQESENRQRLLEETPTTRFNDIEQNMEDLPGMALGAVAQEQEQLTKMAKQIEELQIQRASPTQGARATAGSPNGGTDDFVVVIGGVGHDRPAEVAERIAKKFLAVVPRVRSLLGWMSPG